MSINPRSFEARQQLYLDLFKSMIVKPEAESDFNDWFLEKIKFNKRIYEEVGLKTGIPWHVICCIHAKEASLDLNKGLSNGQPWNQVTTMVPRGRGPFNSFQESAIDSIIYDGLHLIKRWSVEYILWSSERYNGWGFANRNLPSPYLWSGSNKYTKGLFKEIPFFPSWFDEDAVADDLGVAVLLYCMKKNGLIDLKFESDFIDDQPKAPSPITETPDKPVLTLLPQIEPTPSFFSRFFSWLNNFFR